MFSINLDKAKNMWINMYREARTPILKKLDYEYMRAMEDGNQELMVEIKNKKQELRDITNTDLNNISHPEELRVIWPNVLGNPPF